MTQPKNLPYKIRNRELIAETKKLRVQILALEPGESIPFHYHYHSVITDTFICIQGKLKVEILSPAISHFLSVGDKLVVSARSIHRVSSINNQVCRFVIVQGIGQHDYFAVKNKI